MHTTLILLVGAAVAATGQNTVHGPDYIARSAAEKQQLIWENVMMDTTSNDWPSALELPQIFFENICTTLYQGWKLMSCSRCQEFCQQAKWLLIGCTRANS